MTVDRADVQKSDYSRLLVGCQAALAGERAMLANMANFSAYIYTALADISWCGFYLTCEEELFLGPFMGKPAISRIAFGKGVCGTAAREKRRIRVDNVDTFPGHIVCDPDSRSELVLPLLEGTRLLGVFDIDAPVPARFSEHDADGLEELLAAFAASTTLREPCTFGIR